MEYSWLEWDQTIDEINIYINIEKCTSKRGSSKTLKVNVKAKSLHVTLENEICVLKENLPHMVSASDSLWLMEDGILHIILQKVEAGVVWELPFDGYRKLTVNETVEAKQKLNLERFQIEHPGFDFSDAQFCGNVPDPATFMGGPNTKQL